MTANNAMLTKETISQIAHRLHQAEQSREQIRQISLDHPQITIEDAYAIQRQWVDLKINEGRVLKGHKIGLTSKSHAGQLADQRARLRRSA